MVEENMNLDLIKDILRGRMNDEAIENLAFHLTNSPNFAKDLIVLLNAYRLGVKFKTSKQNYTQGVIEFDKENFEA